MKKWLSAGILFVLIISLLSSAMAKNDTQQKNSPQNFKTGVDVLLNGKNNILKGKRVGLITNPTGVDGKLNSIVDAMYKSKDFELKALYGPEHGVRGSEQAGSYVEFYIDKKTNLPVYSLYGPTKKPTPEMLKDIDVLVFDIQDVGTRFYTYIYTMAYAMEAAKENNIEFVVLDRPNPLGGEKVEGPILEPKYATFVGLYPIPLRHGMTVGELAKLFNKEFKINADLKVVKMKGWHRWKTYYETPLQWVLPSPNMPTVDTAFVYPGAGLIEGTNVSEGRGTTRPFETIGAPFIDGDDLAKALNDLKLPGVIFRSNSFTPTFSKFANQLCNGVQIHVTDYNSYNSVDTGLAIVKTIHDMYPNDFQFRAENSQGISYFDNLIGNGWVREEIEKGTPLVKIKAKWKVELELFKKVRKNYLLYK
ncbi:DUF1343 domain-containing protein [Fictibacillus enclensis]|uniref:exo-beta-N-acetylmuramidase NamZ family protein n=1 Tax=Fictibacillus enclensis TaxID=1017270 RepID=UPI0025A0AAF5|nr:DUF1343 domain-containing protein [Fictibacillus enclensis]MDM5339506.1 DUF1343 domain-containing protein [Fictibacillus enclensis]